MGKYFIKRVIKCDDEDGLYFPHFLPNLIVEASDPIFIGVTDQYGNEIFKPNEIVGFVPEYGDIVVSELSYNDILNMEIEDAINERKFRENVWIDNVEEDDNDEYHEDGLLKLFKRKE